MKEYERSFKVESIDVYIDYCKKNNYEEEPFVKQNRIVYENSHSDSIIARLTTEECNNETITKFDCKNVGHKNKDLKISSETIPLIVTDENREIVKSILEVLDFYEAANNNRIRYVFKKDGVKFEIDKYTSPVAKVVAIEGDQDEVEKVYTELKSLFGIE